MAELSRLFHSSPVRWWVEGGAAIDLKVGRQTRSHGDIDVGVVRSEWPMLVRSLTDWDIFAAKDGELTPRATDKDHLVTSFWVRRRGGSFWALQVHLEDGDNESWLYRRDNRVRMEWAEALWIRDGVKVLNPAIQLLWKSKNPTKKDEHDLLAVLPLLSAAGRGWLDEAISTAHPSSPWASRIK